MPWLKPEHTKGNLPHLAILHEVTQKEADGANTDLFDYWLCPDPTLIQKNPITFKIPRLIPPYQNDSAPTMIPTIGSFGFGFADKGFERITSTVLNEFDHAKIRFHIPDASTIIGRRFRNMKYATIRNCKNLVSGSNIELEITESYLDKPALLKFLAGNTLNAFLYDVGKDRGISSTIDYALAVKRPIAINRCGMFRHIYNASPSICIEDTTMKEVIANGTTPLEPFYKEWSQTEFIRTYEKILKHVMP